MNNNPSPRARAAAAAVNLVAALRQDYAAVGACYFLIQRANGWPKVPPLLVKMVIGG